MDCVPSGWSRKLSDDPDFLRWWGFSTAHWGGDVLVVESNGFDPRTWVDHFGYPHTDQMHLQERYQRTNYNTVELSMTITDPTKPESGGGVFGFAEHIGHFVLAANIGEALQFAGAGSGEENAAARGDL